MLLKQAYRLLFLLWITVSPFTVFAIHIVGDQTVFPGDRERYYSTAGGWCHWQWVVTGGTIISPDYCNGNTTCPTFGFGGNEIIVEWNCDPSGMHKVEINNTGSGFGFGCSGSENFSLNVTMLSTSYDVGSISGEDTVCEGATSAYSVPAVFNANNYIWSATGGSIVSGIGTNTISVQWNTAGSQSVSVTAANNGCIGDTFGLPVFVNSLAAVDISGDSTVCGGDTGIVYSTANDTNASYYLWTLPSGATIVSGDSASSITVNFAPYAYSGNITVTSVYPCGSGTTDAFMVTVTPRPSPVGGILGPLSVCIGAMASYHIKPVPNAANYTWTATGATINSGQGTTTVNVTWNSAGDQSVTVVPSNTCGTGPSGNISVLVHPSSATPSVDSVAYNDSTLTAETLFSLVNNPCLKSVSCVNKIIDKAELNILLNLGEDYDFGDNAFNTSVDVEVKCYGAYTGNTPLIASFRKLLSINKDKPEILFNADITPIYYQVNRFDVIIHDYMEDALIDTVITMSVFYTEKFKTDARSITTPVTLNNVDTSSAQTNQLSFIWSSSCTKFPDYEFQLLRLFNTDPADTNSLTTIEALVDWNQALTIETHSSDTSITISLAEGRGYYVWRVRPIGNYFDGGIANDLNHGEWSNHGSFTHGSTVAVSGNVQPHCFFYVQFDDTLNWIYSRTFSEGNKDREQQVRIGEQITYANTLQQVQQEQRHIETNDKVLISQTAYDFSGRPALKSMAVPVENKISLGYQSLFMKNNSGTLYTAGDFDTDAAFNNPAQVKDDNASDHFNYFSDNNPQLNIPNAEGYAFTRTLFYGDGTSRPKEQGGVGLKHTIKPGLDSSRTIKTFYSGVADAELVRVFGDEAPRGESVQKVITVDANRTANVTYISKEGQTIATCLAINGENLYGDTADAMEGLESQQTAAFNVPDTITSSQQYGLSGSQSSKNVSFLEQSTIELHYEIDPASIEDICAGYCRTCDYYIEFLVQDITDPDTPLLDVTRLLPTDICDSASQWDTTFNITVQPGTYKFTKLITAANTDSSTVTDSTMTLSYLQVHLNTLQEYYDSLISAQLDTVNAYLDTPNMNGLYEYLVPGIVLTVNNSDSVFEDSLAYVHFGCDSVGIPILVCPQYPCPPDTVDFAGYFTKRWSASDFFIAVNGLYTPTQLNQMIKDMIADGYACDSLWSCWDAMTQTYSGMVALFDSADAGTFNIVKEFLSCAGKKIQGFDTVAFGDPGPVITQTNNNPGYLSHAYAYFNYRQGDTAVCEQFVCGLCLNGFDNPSDLNPQQWSDLYNCISHATLPPPPDADSTAAANTDSCEVNCEDKRDAFKNSLIRMYHNDSLYVEGDTFYLHLDTLWGQVYTPNSDSALPGGFSNFSVTQNELECMAGTMVQNCKEGCVLTVFRHDTVIVILTPPFLDTITVIDSVGSQAEIAAMTKSLTYSWEVKLPDSAGMCAGSEFELLQPGAAGEPQSLASINKVWDKKFGGNDTEFLGEVIQTSDGGYLMVGSSASGASCDKSDGLIGSSEGFGDIWVVKTNENGIKEWDRTYGGIAGEHAFSTVQISGGYLLAGVSGSGVGFDKSDPNLGSGDFWILKIDSAGNNVWDTTYGGTGNDVLSVVKKTSDGGYLFAGFTNTDTSDHKSEHILGGNDYWVLKTASDGTIQWDRTLGGTGDDRLMWAETTPDDGFILAGYSDSDTSSTGGKSENNIGGEDIWVVKLDGNGTVQWDNTIGGDSSDIPGSIIPVSDGGYIISGTSNSPIHSGGGKMDTLLSAGGSSDLWVIKLHATGSAAWDRTYGINIFSDGLNTTSKSRIIETAAGNYFLGGTRAKLPERNFQYLTLYLNALGDTIWQREWDGSNVEFHSTLLQAQDGGFLISGISNSNVSGDKTQDACGGATPSADFWSIKIDAGSCQFPDFCFAWKQFPNVDSLVIPIEPLTCEQVNANSIRSLIFNSVFDYAQKKLEDFKAQYLSKCADPDSVDDTFWLEYVLGYHHYTLYYYDRAGNLMKTVPPAGVNILDTGAAPGVPGNIPAGSLQRTVQPSHTLVSDYRHNSIKQLARQHNPDGGETKFYYNLLGQLRFSQNEKQLGDSVYSYTKYDALGRIIEVGQSNSDVANINTSAHLNDADFPDTLNTQQTFTVYSTAANITYLNGQTQRYLQNRVSHTYTDEGMFTYFSYDPHGNVEWLVQNINGFKNYISYEYDLVSGNVLKVKYNEVRKDQFYHRYTYDADNRITLTETSRDGKLFDRDARYEYYDHGPLKRSLIGEDKVQGLDYVYTIQGWLKAMNNAAALAETGNVGKDAFAMTLAYYSGDYVRSGSPYNSTASEHLQGKDLFNGNISSWTSNMDFATANNSCEQYPQLTGETYRYDELNRITQSHFKYFTSGWNPITDYQTGYRYDANGNILGLLRNGFAVHFPGCYTGHLDMDSLRYNYSSGTNQLISVDDIVNDTNYTVDIDDQDANNYGYDEIGNMIKDEAEEIDTIEWTVYGKVKKIIRDAASAKPDLEFIYDAAGNRVAKIVKPGADESQWTRTYYVRDPSGNIMSIYEATVDTAITGDTITYVMKEQPIYGSSRIGERKEDVIVSKQNAADSSEIAVYTESITELANLALLLHGSGYVKERDLLLTSSSATLQADLFQSGNTLPGRNICVAEDETGNKLFSAVTHKKLQSLDNVCVVYDKNGNLMTGSTGINSDWQGKALAMRKPGSSSEYYLFTVGINGTPYYHIIDMSGNGGLGTVSSVNQTLVSAINYGRGMALVENQISGGKSYLYLRNYSAGNASVISIEITAAGFGTPQTLATFASNDTKGSGEMQISADKNKFAVANRKGKKKGWFTVSTGELRIFNMANNALLLADTVVLGNVNTSTLDFSPQGDYLFYGIQNFIIPLTVPPGKGGAASALWRYELATGTKQNVTNFGEVRRGKNGKMYVSVQNNQNLKEVSNPDGTVSVANFNATNISGEKLAGVLPLQPNRTLPETEDSLFVRELEKKVYEIGDYLANSRVITSDRKLSTISGGIPTSFTADIKTYYNHLPGGMLAPSRNKFPEQYSFSYNGKLMDNEVYGITGSWYDYGERPYMPLIMRFPTPDPLIVKRQKYPELSSYQYASLNPIRFIDLDGLEGSNPSKKEVSSEIKRTDAPSIQFYIEIKGSFGPQFGAELKTGVPIGGIVKGATVEGSKRFYIEYTEGEGWGFATSGEAKNVDYSGELNLWLFYGVKAAETYGVFEDPVFTEAISETRKGVVKEITRKKEEGQTKEEVINIEFGLEVNPFIIGAGISVGAEGVYTPETPIKKEESVKKIE